MAKKGQAIQLQIEVNTDEEWEKLLQKDGLIVVDVYSDWCGPCLGMQANLKKLKLEIGGDMLQLAVAKSDHIKALERFKNKSEPTWMFLSKGKMIKLMFGADAPHLTRLITEELKNEKLVMEGQPVSREVREVTDLAEEEQARFDAEESIRIAIREKEEAKKAKELLERRTEECNNILSNLFQFAVVLVFPNARDKYREVLNELIEEAGLAIQQTEKVHITEELLEEIIYFSSKEEEFLEESIEELLNEQSLLLLFKPTSRSDVEDTSDAVLLLFYGEKRTPPGDPESAAKRIANVLIEDKRPSDISEKSQQSEKSEKHDKHEKDKKEEVKKPPAGRPSIWISLNPMVRATMLRIFFPKLSAQYYLPEPEPTPEHIAIIFDLYKKDEAMQIVNQYPDEIMHYGFFTSEDPGQAELVSRSNRKLEKSPKRTFQEKFVLQVTKRKSECVLAFAQMNPLYMSPNAKEGERECSMFFPEEYDADGREDENEPEPEPEKKKKKKKKKIKVTDDLLEEMLYFTDGFQFSKKTSEDFGSNKISLAILFKRSSDTLTGCIDDVILQMVYGNSRKYPGDENSPSQKLMKNADSENPDETVAGIWAPPNSFSKAILLKLFFQSLSMPYRLPEFRPMPLHVAAAYDAYKAKDILELSDKYPGQVMNYGFFTSEVPGEAQLIAKTTDKFETRNAPPTYEEKIIVQLAKEIPECFMAFDELNPSYISADVEIGENDCKLFFPSNYNAPEVETVEIKKKSKKKGKTKAAVQSDGDTVSTRTEGEGEASVIETEQVEREDTLIGDEENGDRESGDEEDIKLGEDVQESADKATSPLQEQDGS